MHVINSKDLKAWHLLCWLNYCYNDWNRKRTSEFLWYFREQRHTFHLGIYIQDLRMRLNSARTWQCQPGAGAEGRPMTFISTSKLGLFFINSSLWIDLCSVSVHYFRGFCCTRRKYFPALIHPQMHYQESSF